jgi:glycosyltransferase involved in cell wall biosynthesis
LRAADEVARVAPADGRLPGLSAFFPVFDEESNVVPMAEALLAALPQVARRWELVIVDDGSRDATGALADAFAARHPGVRVVHHERNRGYGAAIRSGLATARLEYVFLTDGDRQFDPAEVARLVPALERADVVVGFRARRSDPLFRRLYAVGWNALVRRLLGLPVRDVNCAFKLMRRDALAGLRLEAEGAAVSAELLARLGRSGRRIVELPVAHFPRRAGRATGGRARVVARAFAELLLLYRRLG